MSKVILLTTLVFSVMFLSPNVVLSEPVKWDDLVKRDGLYYKKFTDLPFTGKTSGKEQGTYKNGKKEGPWAYYHKNGQLFEKGSHKNGKKEGPWVAYNEIGLVEKGYTGTYKDGKKISD